MINVTKHHESGVISFTAAASVTACTTQNQSRRHAISSDVADDLFFFTGHDFGRTLISGL
jgi:hypothetical protein